MSTEHTILLIQFNESDTCSRTYIDFDTLSGAMNGLCQIFEQRLNTHKKETSGDQKVEYVMKDLVKFLDNLADLSCLVHDDVQKIYIPHGKDWIKSRKAKTRQIKHPRH